MKILIQNKKILLTTFLLISIMSSVVSGLKNFAIGIFIFQSRESTISYGFLLSFIALPQLFFAPIAGVISDKFNKKRIVLAVMTVIVLCNLTLWILMYFSFHCLWAIYIIISISAVAISFSAPAFITSITFLVSKQYYGRLTGFLSMIPSITMLVTPSLAALLIETITVYEILSIILAVNVLNILLISLLKFPIISTNNTLKKNIKNIYGSLLYGFIFIKEKKPLMLLALSYMLNSFRRGIVTVVIVPFLLLNGPPRILGLVVSFGGCGLLTGGVVFMLWGGLKSNIKGVYLFQLLCAISTLLIGLFTSIQTIAIIMFILNFFNPAIAAANSSIWLRKTDPENRGKIIAFISMVSGFSMMLSYLVGGTLVDKIFEPLMNSDNYISSIFSMVLVNGKGSGAGLLLSITGLLSLIALLFIHNNDSMKNFEKRILDFDYYNKQLISI